MNVHDVCRRKISSQGGRGGEFRRKRSRSVAKDESSTMRRRRKKLKGLACDLVPFALNKFQTRRILSRLPEVDRVVANTDSSSTDK